VKNLENIWREKIWLILNLDLKMDVNDESSWDYPYISHANDAENLFKPKLIKINNLWSVCTKWYFTPMHEVATWTVLNSDPKPLKQGPCTL
jgi:hypothetical protein